MWPSQEEIEMQTQSTHLQQYQQLKCWEEEVDYARLRVMLFYHDPKQMILRFAKLAEKSTASHRFFSRFKQHFCSCKIFENLESHTENYNKNRQESGQTKNSQI